MKEKIAYPPIARRLRLGMIGGGGYGLVAPWHCNGIRLSGRWDLVAGALSSDPQKARRYGEEWLLPADRIYGDYKEMARKESARKDGIEAVAICTPNHLHREMAECFMEAGIDVVCEKPMTLSAEDCEAILERLKERSLVFAIAHPYVYHPMVRQAREMVAAGAIGNVRQALVEYAQEDSSWPDDPENKTAAWRRDPAKVGRASTTGDVGTHALQMIEFVCGKRVLAVRADFHVCGAPKPLEDTAFISLNFEGNVPGFMWVSQAAPGNHCGLRFRIYGEKGGLEWDQEFPEQLRYARLGEAQQVIWRGRGSGMAADAERMIMLPRGHGETLAEAWAHLYTEVALAVEVRRHGRRMPEDLALQLPGIEVGIRGVHFVNAAADSHEAGGEWVEML